MAFLDLNLEEDWALLDSFEEALAKDGRLKGVIVGGGRLELSKKIH